MRRLSLLVAVLLAAVVWHSLGGSAARHARSATVAIAATNASSSRGLHVRGNRLLDGRGQAVALHGVDRAGSEYACIQGFGIFEAPVYTNDDAQAALIARWHANSVLVGLNEDCWLGINGVSRRFGGASYRKAIIRETRVLEQRGLYPIVGLFWSAPGRQQARNQAAMPDADHSPAFWHSVARTFAGDPQVVLRLKEEPFPAGNSDGGAAWRCWSTGDVQYAPSGALHPSGHHVTCHEGYRVVGMQSLINIIRAAGARNVVQVPGVQYANSLRYFLNPAYRVRDAISPAQLMADVDVYPEENLCGSASCYSREYAPVISRMPFMAGETGEGTNARSCPTARVDALLRFLDARRASYAAWAWDTWGGCLQLIDSYRTGAPHGRWGRDYHDHLARVR